MNSLAMKKCFLVLIVTLLGLNGCKKIEPVTMVKTNGEEVHFSNTGEGDVTLIFIHGFGNSNSIWDGQISYFSEKYKVIAPNLPGFGPGTFQRTEWTMENYGKDIAGLVRELELTNVVLVGFSMGAPVAIEAAHLLKEDVISLVLVDQIKDLYIHFTDEMIEGFTVFLNDLRSNHSEEKLVQAGFFKQNTEESYQKVTHMMDELVPDPRWDDIFANIFKWTNERDEKLLSELTLPITIINSDNEPTNKDQLNSVISNLKIEVVENSGHVLFWDFPEKFNSLVEESIR